AVLLKQLIDPHPERWGRRSATEGARLLNDAEAGLASREAGARLRTAPHAVHRQALLTADLQEARSPVHGIPLGGAVSSLGAGAGRAVVGAGGRDPRLGATAAALSLDEIGDSPFGARLARLLQVALPVAAAGGAIVVGSGLLWGRPLQSQLSVGVSIALAAVP